MCGILGILSRCGRELSERQVIAMRDAMTARGPDDAGLFRHGPMTLAHRRLAIRDLAAGAQPWLSQNGRFAIVYNGEIYNEDLLATDLRDAGVQLTTRCDTEALLESWSLWGPGCVTRLRGMFAFAVYDLQTQDVWLVRDRCGVKPLFYANVDGDFVFASSIAAIRRHPEFSSMPNLQVIGHYLQTLRLTLDHQTVFEDIHTVRPAEMIRVSGQNVTHQTWWNLPESSADHDYETARQQLKHTLTEAVKLRLKSDVPVSLMISGGVDSSTLTSITRHHRAGSILGCCGGGRIRHKVRLREADCGDSRSDFHYARQCASDMDIEYSEVGVPSDEYLQTWRSLISQYETPVSTPTDAIIHQVSRRLKQTSGVAIGGEGADEAFCGYAIAHWSGNDFDRLRNIGQLDAGTAHQVRQTLAKHYGTGRFESQAGYYLATHSLLTPPTQQRLFHDALWSDVNADNAAMRYYDGLFAEQTEYSSSERIKRVLFRTNLESLLGRLDSATMSAGLEARVPFTDHVLVEQAFRMPHHFKIDMCPQESKPWLSAMQLDARGSLRSKRILRSVASELMSPKLAERPKMSFPTPIRSWLANDWRPWVRDTLLNSPFASQLFRRSALEELANAPPELSLWTWPVLNVAMWGDECFA